MSIAVAAEPETAQLATVKALLSDTLELLQSLKYADDASRSAARIQYESIVEIFPEFRSAA